VKRATNKKQPLAVRKAALKAAKSARAVLDLAAEMRAKSPKKSDVSENPPLATSKPTLLAWKPKAVSATLGGVVILGPAPVTLTKDQWISLLEDRVQTMIQVWEENVGEAEPVIQRLLEEAGAFPPPYLRIERQNWAANIIAGISMLDTPLFRHGQVWPATVTRSNCDFDTLENTMLEEWLIGITP